MLEAEHLLQLLNQHFAPQLLTNKHILITAGPTHEAIDPVRFLSNHSSGKMGYALAEAALQLGATVTLISGPTMLKAPSSTALTFCSVTSAQSMLDAVMHNINTTKVDIFIGCAAVADYAPVHAHLEKIKKSSATYTLELIRTPDILATVAQLPAKTRPFTIGFAAETENLLKNAQQKLQHKCLDMIIANAVDNGKVFNQAESQAWILGKDATAVELPLMRKESLAFKILEAIGPE